MPGHTIYWSEFSKWLECQQRWSFEYQQGRRNAGEPSEQMLEGIRIGKRLAERLRDVGGFKPGRDAVLREYHFLYSDDSDIKWRAEIPFDRDFGGVTLSAIADGVSQLGLDESDFIRETKVTGDPQWFLYQQQLLWLCYCAEMTQGELDILLRPGYMRADWAFQRKVFHFTEADFNRFEADVRSFLRYQESGPSSPVRNGHACKYCPFTADCWG